MKKSYHVVKTILPVTWSIDYNKSVALVNVKNAKTGYDNTVMVDYRMFGSDLDLTEAFLNISLMDEVQTSFHNDDKYLDWLTYSIDKGLIEDRTV